MFSDCRKELQGLFISRDLTSDYKNRAIIRSAKIERSGFSHGHISEL
jgi:hypothetical protein